MRAGKGSRHTMALKRIKGNIRCVLKHMTFSRVEMREAHGVIDTPLEAGLGVRRMPWFGSLIYSVVVHTP